jgi:hypothetical protein
LFCELTKSLLTFFLEAGEDNREADYVALNLEADITSITLQGFIITINKSLLLKFDTNEALNTFVTTLKEILGDKFVISDNQNQEKPEKIGTIKAKNLLGINFREESEVSRIDEDKKEASDQKIIPGQTHSNHKCPLIPHFYGGRNCDICRKSLRHG